jgi:hypothetical protein
MKKILLALGFIWALPLSIFGFALGVFLIMAGQIELKKWNSNFTITWDLTNDGWFHRRKFKRRGWVGYSCGCNIFVKDSLGSRHRRTMRHETCHCLQQFAWGVFFLVAYPMDSILIWIFESDKHSYYDNHFERAARKAAGQWPNVPRGLWANGPDDRWAWW